MLRLLVIGAAIFIAYKLIFGGKKKVKKSFEQVDTQSVGDMVKDPICGTYISADSDIRVRDGDKVYFFCSYECRDKFLMTRKHEDK